MRAALLLSSFPLLLGACVQNLTGTPIVSAPGSAGGDTADTAGGTSAGDTAPGETGEPPAPENDDSDDTTAAPPDTGGDTADTGWLDDGRGDDTGDSGS